MLHTYLLLVKGDPSVLQFYQDAVARWNDIWQRPAAKNLESLADLLSSEELWFQNHCGSRSIGEEIMVISGFFAMSYAEEIGFIDDDKVRLLYDAFQASMCRWEVKAMAETVAIAYHLIDNNTYSSESARRDP